MREFLKILSTVALLALPNCSLDTSVANLPLSITVEPAYVCPGEQVTVTWDAGEQDESCPTGLVGVGTPGAEPFERCVFVELNSSPTAVIWGDGVDRQTRGSRTVAIASTNTFTIRARSDNYGGHGLSIDRTATATATVIDSGPARQTFSFDGECVGSTAGWRPVSLRTLLSTCIEVQEVCNLSGDIVRLDDLDAPGSRTVTLVPTACTSVFNGPATNLSAQSLTFTPRPDVCGSVTTSGAPPSLQISVQVACNRDLPACAL
jgi:hypothetical protein